MSDIKHPELARLGDDELIAQSGRWPGGAKFVEIEGCRLGRIEVKALIEWLGRAVAWMEAY